MNLKKIAVRALAALAVCVALCMFFAGTVRTITTPKVKLISGRRGKLEEKISLIGKLTFTEVTPLEVKLPADVTLTVTKVNTRPGYTVKAGDVLVEAKVTNYDSVLKTFRDAYDQASEQLLTLENKNRGLRITKRDEAYAEAYFGLRDARTDVATLSLELDAMLAREGLERVEDGYPEGASEALMALIDRYRAALEAREEADRAMQSAARYSVEEDVWAYITESRELSRKIDDAEANLRALVLLNDSVSAIEAPHDGYTAVVNVKEGESYDGSLPLLTLTAEGADPVLRCDVSDIARAIAEGSTVTMDGDSGYESTVSATGIDAEGKRYVDVALTKDIIRARGTVYAMTLEDTPLTLIYRAKDSTTLLPVTAVRGSGEDRYVFVTEKNASAFGGDTLKLRKLPVNVQAESGGTASIDDDITYYTIAYMEDRPVNEGDAVMEYLQ